MDLQLITKSLSEAQVLSARVLEAKSAEKTS
jgi:hypothetical protein